MNAVSFVASLLLGAAFVVAGVSKLAAGPDWPSQARELGAPDVAIKVLPWVELALGALLVVQLLEPFAALAAIGLLLVFSGVIVARLREGRRPRCACFGAWSSKPIGPSHLVRNGGLVVVGVVAMLG